MSDTTYVDFGPPAVTAAWLNDVNNAIYRALANNGAIPQTPAQVIQSLGIWTGGPTASRPVTPFLYQSYFDATLGQPVWCKQVSPAIWVNAAGVQV